MVTCSVSMTVLRAAFLFQNVFVFAQQAVLLMRCNDGWSMDSRRRMASSYATYDVFASAPLRFSHHSSFFIIVCYYHCISPATLAQAEQQQPTSSVDVADVAELTAAHSDAEVEDGGVSAEEHVPSPHRGDDETAAADDADTPAATTSAVKRSKKLTSSALDPEQLAKFNEQAQRRLVMCAACKNEWVCFDAHFTYMAF